MFRYNGPLPFVTLACSVILESIELLKTFVCVLVTIFTLGFISCTWFQKKFREVHSKDFGGKSMRYWQRTVPPEE